MSEVFDRRRFLAGAGLATAGALVPEVSAQSAVSDKSQDVPPPIAALKSHKAEAKPITATERRQRIEKARRLMAEHEMDALLVCGGSTLEYFAGIKWWLSERFFGMILPAKGEPFFVSPAFEEDRAREQIASG